MTFCLRYCKCSLHLLLQFVTHVCQSGAEWERPRGPCRRESRLSRRQERGRGAEWERPRSPPPRVEAFAPPGKRARFPTSVLFRAVRDRRVASLATKYPVPTCYLLHGGTREWVGTKKGTSSNELPLPAVGRLAAASSLLRDLIAANGLHNPSKRARGSR